MLVWTPSDEDAYIRAASAEAPPSPYRELANPAWLAVMQSMPLYKNLLIAAFEGDAVMTQALLLHGADPSLADNSSDNPQGLTTPLITAVRLSHLSVVRLLVAYGADVDAKDMDGTLALHAAVIRCADCVEVLMRAGCDPYLESTRGRSAIDLVSRQLQGDQKTIGKSREAVKRLKWLLSKPYVGVVVELGGLVGGAEHNGKLAAVRRYKSEKGRFDLELLESGRRMDVRPSNFVLKRLPVGTQVVTTDFDEPGDNGIRGSVGWSEYEVGADACWLRKHGAWPGGGAAWSFTYWDIPADYEEEGIYELQQEVRQTVHEPQPVTAGFGSEWPATATQILIPMGHLALVPTDLPSVAPSTHTDILNSELVRAVRAAVLDGGGVAAAWRYLAAGADPNTPCTDQSGVVSSPLAAAAAWNNVEMVRLLLDAGASLLKLNEHTTPLIAAAANGSLEVLRLLLAWSADGARLTDVDACPQNFSKTAFHVACQNDHADCAMALVQAGCDMSLTDEHGLNGLDRSGPSRGVCICKNF
jgi:ankyrin repeat protein